MTRTRTTGAIAGFILVSFGLAACGEAATQATTSDDEPAEASDDPADPADDPVEPADAGGATVTVRGVDYGFEGVPDEVAVGTELTFVNASEEEVHELVLFRRPDGEDRPAEDLLALPEEERALTFEGVAFAMPGEDGPVADGDLVLDEPGEYILVCHLPVGATPEVVDSEEFPEDAPPHFAEGMIHELSVR